MVTVTMRTADECLAKAAQLERIADYCVSPGASAEYREMAHSWRHVASQARWQDARLDADIRGV